MIWAGGVILGLVLVGVFAVIAWDVGWRWALVIMAGATAVTALIAAGALLIGYGIEGRL